MSKSVAPEGTETKPTGCAQILERNLPTMPLISNQTLQSLASLDPVVRAVWRPVVRLSAAGEVGSRVIDPEPQPLFL